MTRDHTNIRVTRSALTLQTDQYKSKSMRG